MTGSWGNKHISCLPAAHCTIDSGSETNRGTWRDTGLLLLIACFYSPPSSPVANLRHCTVCSLGTNIALLLTVFQKCNRMDLTVVSSLNFTEKWLVLLFSLLMYFMWWKVRISFHVPAPLVWRRRFCRPTWSHCCWRRASALDPPRATLRWRQHLSSTISPRCCRFALVWRGNLGWSFHLFVRWIRRSLAHYPISVLVHMKLPGYLACSTLHYVLERPSLCNSSWRLDRGSEDRYRCTTTRNRLRDHHNTLLNKVWRWSWWPTFRKVPK